jgi:hypothetical protein
MDTFGQCVRTQDVAILSKSDDPNFGVGFLNGEL